MISVNVVVPVLKGRTVFIVDKGRPWSVVEHVILEALTGKAWTAAELATAGNISRRVVVESCTRLMRSGWVELIQDDLSVRFRATPRGASVAKNSELPTVLERKKKPASYIVDLIAGDVFRSRDWVIRHEQELKERSKTEAFVWIEPASSEVDYSSEELIDLLLEEDETFVDAEPSGPARRYAVVTVKDGIVDGLPAGRELPELRATILAAASKVTVGEKESVTMFSIPGPRGRVKTEIPEIRPISFDNSDLILDGEAHKRVISVVFAEARSKIFIHSTFINEERFLAFLPDITNAVRRGVRVHVFWGQNEEVDEVVSSQAAVTKLRRNAAVIGLGPSLVIHPFSTGSHAKLIVADAGEDGKHIAIVGSCNWLVSNFTSYEVSVKLRDPRIVRDVVEYLSRLSCHNGVWSELASELANVCQKLTMTTLPSSANAQASVVIGAQHNHFVLQARDEAKSSAFVASHRLGPVSSPSVIVPFTTAAKERGISGQVFYGRTTGAVRAKAEADLASQAIGAGITLTPVKSPRLHAKVLAWDEDCVLISSLNWLSADPTELDSLKEIGIWIQATGVAKTLMDHFHRAVSSIQ